jgi:hypothetical protein
VSADAGISPSEGEGLVGPIGIQNRIYFPPHPRPSTVGSGPPEDFAQYYADRAVGGVRLPMHIVSVVPLRRARESPVEKATIASFAALADVVHQHGRRSSGTSRTAGGTRRVGTVGAKSPGDRTGNLGPQGSLRGATCSPSAIARTVQPTGRS